MKNKKGFTWHLSLGQKKYKNSTHTKDTGFTLIELLIVIGIIAILAAIVFVAVDPARRLAEARNAERWSSTNAMLNAILKSTVDSSGTSPVTEDTQAIPVAIVAGTTYEIGTAVSSDGCSASSASLQVDLSSLVDQYLSSVPTDSETGNAANTGYYFSKSTNGRITIGACESEDIGGDPVPISVTR